jgi:hypothetical protein
MSALAGGLSVILVANDDATLQKALTFAAIGAVTFGVASLGFLAITSNKKSQFLQS